MGVNVCQELTITTMTNRRNGTTSIYTYMCAYQLWLTDFMLYTRVYCTTTGVHYPCAKFLGAKVHVFFKFFPSLLELLVPKL